MNREYLFEEKQSSENNDNLLRLRQTEYVILCLFDLILKNAPQCNTKKNLRPSSDTISFFFLKTPEIASMSCNLFYSRNPFQTLST